MLQLTTKAEQDQLYSSFKALDTNNDGKLSKKELLEGYKKIYPHLSEAEVAAEVDKLFLQADQDGSGEIDYSEWSVAAINKYSILQEEKLKGAFALFDKDQNGSISAQEIKQVLGVGKKFGNESIFDEIIKEVDINGDGVITFEEFKIMMRRFLDEEIKSNSSFSQNGRTLAVIEQA